MKKCQALSTNISCNNTHFR